MSEYVGHEIDIPYREGLEEPLYKRFDELEIDEFSVEKESGSLVVSAYCDDEQWGSVLDVIDREDD